MTPLEPELARRNLDRCKRCQAEILWARTTNGKLIPIDAGPVFGGNVELAGDDIGQLKASVVRPAGDVEAYVSHFSTCEFSEYFRRDEPEPAPDHDAQHSAKLKALQMRMPFGKHSGKTLEEVDRDDHRYLAWAARNLEFRSRELGAAVKLIAGVE